MENPDSSTLYKYDYGFKPFGEVPKSFEDSPSKIRVISWNTLAHKYKGGHERNYKDKSGIEPPKRNPMLVNLPFNPIVVNHEGQCP